MTFRFERGHQDNLGLPRKLDNNLVLRWGKPEDATELAAFLGNIFAEDGQPDESVMYSIRDWMSGAHPTIGPEDFTIVTNEAKGGMIVSTLNLTSQIWAYDGIPFGVGQIEAVATDPDYRRLGLVRQQMAVVHSRSAARGELMQVIAGIPWYYRQFGYEMGLSMQGERSLYRSNVSTLAPNQVEPYRLRPAKVEDIELLARLYAIHCAASLVAQLRSASEWRYELAVSHPQAKSYRRFHLIESTTTGQTVGYLEIGYYPEGLVVRELAVLPGHPLRSVAEFLTRALIQLCDEQAAAEGRSQPYERVIFRLGTDHPGYTALGRQLTSQTLPYGWYVRISNLEAFLAKIAPALDKRLAASVFDGYSGSLRLNFYHSHLNIEIEAGKFSRISSYQPASLEDGDAAFPNLTFSQLLLGYRSLRQLEHAYADCAVKDARTASLLEALFPPKPSSVAAAV